MESSIDVFEIMKYEVDLLYCAQGPILRPKNSKEEKNHLCSKLVNFIALGTPVICQGLEQPKHVNGQIGDFRWSCGEETYYHKVHFEGKNPEPCSVNRQNIRNNVFCENTVAIKKENAINDYPLLIIQNMALPRLF